MAREIGIAAVAARSAGVIEDDLAAIERLVVGARGRGADLVVLPECALGGYLRDSGVGEGPPDLPPAIDPDGPEIARLVRAAGETVVCLGYTEAGGPHGPWSTGVCLSGDGVLDRHRKVHLPPAERFAYSAGDGFAAFDTPVGRLGMLLCYDKLFPEAARTLALDGADVIASMAAWPVDRRRPAADVATDRQTRHFDLMDAARAVENQVVWVSANQSGPWGRLRFLGRAKVVDPDGNVLAETLPGAGQTALARIDPVLAVADSRVAIDHLGDRRPAAYGGPRRVAGQLSALDG